MRTSGDGKIRAVVCHIDREGLRPDVLREHDANAALIAAAPELLEALKYLMRYDFGDSVGAKEARAVIEKAEGR